MNKREIARKFKIPINDLVQRSDGRIERLCNCGVGHIIWAPKTIGTTGIIHECCGCCNKWMEIIES